jgi:hypothetical protein
MCGVTSIACVCKFVCGNTVAGQVLYSVGHTEDSTVCYVGKRAFDCFLSTIIIQQMRTYIDLDRTSRKVFQKMSISSICVVKS